MVSLNSVEQQLKQIGCNFRVWGRAELKELCEILLPGEKIAQAVNGQYEGGFAMLVATDFRVLLIDKKPKYLTLKDVRFDMITELDFSSRMLNSTIRVYTPNKELRFTAINGVRLRKLFTHTQHKVMEIRNHFLMQQYQQAHDMKNMPPGLIISNAIQGQAAQFGQQFAPQYSQQPPQPVAHQNDSSDEHRKLAAAMGAAGLRSLVHNGMVVRDYMAVPFTQRWRKRPYGYSNSSLQKQV